MAQTQKVLNTRIALKYDSYANWSTSTLVLLAGELGICTIPAKNDEVNTGYNQATTNPTILFKVGDGVTPAKDLKWTSALAADVYGWAKSETVSLETVEVKDGEGKVTGHKQYLRFKTGEIVNHEVDLSSFATDEEVNAIKETIESRLSTIEANLGLGDTTGNGSVTSQLADHADRIEAAEDALTIINSTSEDQVGSIKNAIKQAKAYAESQDNTLKTELQNYADNAVSDQAETQTATDSAQDKLIADNKKAIEDETKARADADDLINEKFGYEYSAEDTVADAIAAAKLAGTNAATAVENLTKVVDGKAVGQVAINAENIATVASDLSSEIQNRINGDKDLDTRLKEVEAFFEGAAKDGEGLDNALDKLVEIQEYLSGEGTAADGLLGTVNDHEDRIKAVEDDINTDKTGIKARLTQAESDIDAVEGRAADLEARADALETLTGAEGTIQTAIKEAKNQADKGVEDAGKAQKAADEAQEAVDALTKVVSGEGDDKGLAGDIETNASDISKLNAKVDLGETETVKGVIASSLGALDVSSPEADGESVSFIDTISQTDGKISATKKTIPNANADTAGIVKLGVTGGAATFDVVDTMAGDVADHGTRLGNVEGNYVRVSDDNKMYLGKEGVDYIIFNCGGATE